MAERRFHLNFLWTAVRKHAIVDEPQIVTGILHLNGVGAIPDLLLSVVDESRVGNG
jgi:hypothetical protein